MSTLSVPKCYIKMDMSRMRGWHGSEATTYLATEKGSNLKGKNDYLFVFFFPFRINPFSEGAWFAGKQKGSYKSCLPCKKWQKILQKITVPLKKILFYQTYIVTCYTSHKLGL